MRPEVQLPAESRSGVMRRLPLPSSETLLVLLVIVSTSPVPQLAGPPGYEVPVLYCQLELLTPVPAAPVKSSRKTCVQPDGGVGAEAFAGRVTAAAAAAASPSVLSTATSARRRLGMPEVALMGVPLGYGGRCAGDFESTSRARREHSESALKVGPMCSPSRRPSRLKTRKVL